MAPAHTTLTGNSCSSHRRSRSNIAAHISKRSVHSSLNVLSTSAHPAESTVIIRGGQTLSTLVRTGTHSSLVHARLLRIHPDKIHDGGVWRGATTETPTPSDGAAGLRCGPADGGDEGSPVADALAKYLLCTFAPWKTAPVVPIFPLNAAGLTDLCQQWDRHDASIINRQRSRYLRNVMLRGPRGPRASTELLLLPWLVPSSGVAGIADDLIPPCCPVCRVFRFQTNFCHVSLACIFPS